MAALPRDPAVARIIDANLNRAAEALRTAEDVCRFGLGLQGFSRELKELRHGILGLFAPLPGDRSELVRARDIEEDVGKGTGSPEAPPADLPASLLRNLQRAKEALRSLEEAGRLRDPSLPGNVEGLRYRLYSLEKGILHLLDRPKPPRMARARLYLIATEALTGVPLVQAVEAALAGGAGAVQLREKRAPDRLVLSLGRALREVTARAGVPLILNDRPDLAVLIGADGVHLGQDDLPVSSARAIVGKESIVGVSTHSCAEALRAAREGADYIGAGPVFQTATKDAGPPIGVEGLRAIVEAVDLPSFAIGGIRPENAADLAPSGCPRAAVSSGILAAGSPQEIERAAREIVAALEMAGEIADHPPAP